jgi:tRNA-dihydrouridine synthase B
MLTIADLKISSPLILAPLAGYSDLPFRLLCREFGAGLCVSEMISCHGLVFQQKKTLQMLASIPAERPVAFQLFGADVAIMGKAADLLNGFQPDLVDINMGCPVRKVTKKGAGAALMAQPALAEKIIREVVKNSQAPVSVKFRKGIDSTTVNCIDFAKMAEESGAAAISVHGRTWSQGFAGEADWQSIADVKKAVSLPVIGNGDIQNYQQAMQQLETSGCDGVMIGRGALGNPWAFSKNNRPENAGEIFPTVLHHLNLMRENQKVERLLPVIKNHIGRYFKNLQGSSAMRKKIYESTSFDNLFQLVEKVVEYGASDAFLRE